MERLLFHFQGLDAVQAVNGRRNIPGAFIDFFDILVVDEGDEIKIVFRKEQGQGLQPPLNDFPVLQPTISHIDITVLLNGLTEVPHSIEETRPVPRFDVVKGLIINQAGHHSLIRRWHTAGNHLVQHVLHFRFDESPTVEQNLAQRQDFTIGQLLRLAAFHAVALFHIIIDNITRRSIAKGHAIAAESPDILNIPLNTALIHTILLGSRRLLDRLPRQKLRIQPQYPRNLILLQIITFNSIISLPDKLLFLIFI